METRWQALVSCEASGEIRRRINARPGWSALSVDLRPAEDGEVDDHLVADVRTFLGCAWDLLIGHPPCTRLANSGVRWLHKPPKNPPEGVGSRTWASLTEASKKHAMHLSMLRGAQLFRQHLDAEARHIAVENPVMHRLARERIGGRRPDFTVQPWQFGDPYTKRTCFWTKNLPALKPTHPKPAPEEIEALKARGKWDAVHRAPPGPERGNERSRTFPGMAQAIVDQWCAYVEAQDR